MLASQSTVTLEFNNLTYHVPDLAKDNFTGFIPTTSKRTKTILKNASGTFRPGQLTAIMGPSGAGKTTLMNILAGFKNKNVEGTVSVNGRPRNLSQFRRLSCYIMQDDVPIAELTVLESMRYAAQLKLPRKTSKEKRESVIKEILDTIGLFECKDVCASAISGGQRKRLSIALELINNKPIMFADEPVTGLDSSACFSCVTLLKSLAQGGRTIVATIHQPSARILEQFDCLYLLTKGQTIYNGSTHQLVPYLEKFRLKCPENHNPADFAIEIAIGHYGNQCITALADAAAAAPAKSDPLLSNTDGDPSAIVAMDENGNVTPQLHDDDGDEDLVKGDESLNKVFDDDNHGNHDNDNRFEQFLHQFWIILKRSMVCLTRNVVLTNLRFAMTVFAGLLIGITFHGVGNNAAKCFSNSGNMFFAILYVSLAAMMTTILTFPMEREVLIREHLNSWYSLKAYYLARSFADLPFQIFFPILYIVIAYYMTDQPLEFFRFALVCLVCILVSLVSQSIGLFIGAFCDIQSAVFIAPVTAIPFFLFSGSFMTLSSVPGFLRWISWFSYPRYGFQSSLTAVFGFERGNLNCFEEYCHFKNPKKFLQIFDMEQINVGHQAMCLLIMFVVIRFLSYFALRIKIMADR